MKLFWRILKWGVLTLIILIATVLIYISAGFGKLDFKDDFVTVNDYSSYFPESYIDARAKFRSISAELAIKYSNVKFCEFKVPSAFDNDLTVGVCYIPAQKDSSNLLIISSGTHGVEGFTGHAAQELFIHNFLTADLISTTGILLIHSINPYGFKHNRRVTENNVDMNRNSSISLDLYSSVNEGYPKVYDLINPKGEVNAFSIGNRFFFLKAINEIRKASLPVLRQAVLQGQYQFPEGLYFGGKKPEPQIDSLKPIIENYCKPYEKIMAIDMHTGYGERGKLHFFPNPMKDEGKAKLENLYEGFTIDWGDSDDFYTVTGDFVGFVGTLNPGKEYYPMIFEYGTLNSQTTMGSLKSIHIMILENQGQKFGFASEKDSLRVKGNLREMYFPQSTNWRNYSMEQTSEVFTKVLPRFSAK